MLVINSIVTRRGDSVRPIWRRGKGIIYLTSRIASCNSYPLNAKKPICNTARTIWENNWHLLHTFSDVFIFIISFDLHNNSARQGVSIIPTLQTGMLRPKQFQDSLKVTQLVRRHSSCKPWSFPPPSTDSLTADSWDMAAQARAINGPIVCVHSRAKTLGTRSFVCLWAATPVTSAPLNVKDTMGSKSLSIQILGIITKINFVLSSSRENKNPWVSHFTWPWLPLLWNEFRLDWLMSVMTHTILFHDNGQSFHRISVNSKLSLGRKGFCS